jgi:hypothetical protein
MLKSLLNKFKMLFQQPTLDAQAKLNSEQKANKIIQSIENGDAISSIENKICTDKNDWHRCTSVAYNLYLIKARKERTIAVKKPHVSATSNKEIEAVLELNNILADHALSMSILSTSGDLRHIQNLVKHLPSSEQQIVEAIGKITMHPRYRVLQKK